MGGNALSFETRRVGREEFFEISSQIMSIWDRTDIWLIPSYHYKEDFGDVDLIVRSIPGVDYRSAITSLFKPKEIFHNGNCYSFDYKDVQIDFIVTHPVDVFTSLEYFGYNDRGNLIGRVAHKFGLKFGHDGLKYLVKDGDYLVKEIMLSKNFHETLEFLGFDASRRDAMHSPEDIFEFIRSSKFYAYSIFDLDNRNAIARLRERKRKMYMAFLEWAKNNPKPVEFDYSLVSKDSLSLAAIFRFGKQDEYFEALRERRTQVLFKQRFNGSLVSEMTGYKGQELGKFMKAFLDKFPKKELRQMSEMQIQSEIENFERQYE